MLKTRFFIERYKKTFLNVYYNYELNVNYINSPAHCCITQPPVEPSGDCERVIS